MPKVSRDDLDSYQSSDKYVRLSISLGKGKKAEEIRERGEDLAKLFGFDTLSSFITYLLANSVGYSTVEEYVDGHNKTLSVDQFDPIIICVADDRSREKISDMRLKGEEKSDTEKYMDSLFDRLMRPQ